ncbi:hypothetical protein WH96_08940 [Kiloniella spongiae]|uniref:Uncharacterized protein n=1 Tax=Kiloniella spongiae TaxID=1489064 RepID=A0A0H2MEJ2_9PROT|nr:hypothetical protein WH96_08940 [Kiloniella spongiae]
MADIVTSFALCEYKGAIKKRRELPVTLMLQVSITWVKRIMLNISISSFGLRKIRLAEEEAR